MNFNPKLLLLYVHDHLGNNRIVTDVDGEVVQSNEYYPFGLLMASSVYNEIKTTFTRKTIWVTTEL